MPTTDDAILRSAERNRARMYATQAQRAREQQARAERAGDTNSALLLRYLVERLRREQVQSEARCG